MTKHRKILEGVSEGPWSWHFNDQGYCSIPGIAVIDFDHDAEFIVYARNHAEDICDLIEAVEEYLKPGLKIKDLDTLIKIDRIQAALDKLNGNAR